ncbi:MAG: AAA family ATPase [Planctomycetes bacterium]|nr:AAA family ATPase [Planctomycetota bacterium]
MQTIALINQKGGVGKTTTAANLAAALAARGLRIGMIDLDPQSHLTMHFGIDPDGQRGGAYEVLTQDLPLGAAMVEVAPGLSIVPASLDLVGAEIELAAVVGREQLLRDRFEAEDLPFDYVLMDCPPSLSLLTLNALAAADEVLIPLQPHFLALQGMGKLLETVALVRRRINPRLRVGGIVLCMYESNTRLASEVTDDVAAFLAAQNDPAAPWAEAKLYAARIRRNVKLAECPSFGQSIFHYAPGCPGAQDYDALAEEFLAAHGATAQDAAAPDTGAEAPQATDAAAHEAEPSGQDEPEAPADDRPARFVVADLPRALPAPEPLRDPPWAAPAEPQRDRAE